MSAFASPSIRPNSAICLYSGADKDQAAPPTGATRPPVDLKLYADVNGNGLLDGGDTQVGATIQSSAADGTYSFGNIAPGKYLVQQTPPTGYQVTSPASGVLAFTLVNRGTATGGDFYNKNLAPTAVSGGTYTINEGDSLNLNGSATDGNNSLWTYRWDLDNDGQYDDSIQAASATGASRRCSS